MRQPWLASTISSTSEPTASRTASTTATSVAPVGVVEAQLDRPHAGVAQRRHAARALVRLDELAARGVGEDPLGAAAEQPPQRLAERAGDQVPDRDLGGPRPPAVEVDRLAQLAHDLGAARVEADQQPLEQRRVGQVVAPLA